MHICRVTICLNELCIYQSHKCCLLDQVGINEMGHCDAFVMLDFEAQELEQRKAAQLAVICHRLEY